MIYVEIMGGLGNQMFQYTFSKYLEKITGSPVILHLDFFDYVKNVPGATVRELDLDKMKTDYVSVSGQITCSQMIEEEQFSGVGAIGQLSFFRGYWQDKKYFESVKDIVCRDFEIKDIYLSDSMRETVELMKKTNSASLHIRRTDYLTGQNVNIFSAQSDSYYEKALQRIVELTDTDPTVFVFSDDVDYAEKLMGRLGLSSYHIMPCRKAYEDLYLMSMTRHHIIANSSFSWWAAALGQSRYPSGIVVAPLQWFKDRPAPNLYIDNWVKL